MQYKQSRIEYACDFGDSWRRIINVQGRARATESFLCSDGEDHGVTEDMDSNLGLGEAEGTY